MFTFCISQIHMGHATDLMTKAKLIVIQDRKLKMDQIAWVIHLIFLSNLRVKAFTSICYKRIARIDQNLNVAAIKAKAVRFSNRSLQCFDSGSFLCV